MLHSEKLFVYQRLILKIEAGIYSETSSIFVVYRCFFCCYCCCKACSFVCLSSCLFQTVYCPLRGFHKQCLLLNCNHTNGAIVAMKLKNISDTLVLTQLLFKNEEIFFLLYAYFIQGLISKQGKGITPRYVICLLHLYLKPEL